MDNWGSMTFLIYVTRMRDDARFQNRREMRVARFAPIYQCPRTVPWKPSSNQSSTDSTLLEFKPKPKPESKPTNPTL